MCVKILRYWYSYSATANLQPIDRKGHFVRPSTTSPQEKYETYFLVLTKILVHFILNSHFTGIMHRKGGVVTCYAPKKSVQFQ